MVEVSGLPVCDGQTFVLQCMKCCSVRRNVQTAARLRTLHLESSASLQQSWRGVTNEGKLKRCYRRGYVEEVLWMVQMRVCWRGVTNKGKVECYSWDSYRESKIIELCNWICNIASAIMMIYWMVIYTTAKSTVCIPNTAVLGRHFVKWFYCREHGCY